MAHIDANNLNEYQYDILWDILSDNTLLPYSPIKTANKQLNTTSKNIIRAINELLDNLNTQKVTVNTFSDRFNNIIGNTDLDPELVTNLKKIDTNVIKAIYKIYLEIVGDPSQVADISHLGSNIKSAILELDTLLKSLDDRVSTIEEKLKEVEVIEKLSFNPEKPTEFSISKIPTERITTLKINGIEYNEVDDYSVDRVNKKVIWLDTLASGEGFDIESDFNVVLKYWHKE